MRPKFRIMIVLAAATLLTGCATTGGTQVQNAAYQTHRHVANLETNLQGSVQQLNQTAAGLLARVDSNDQALRNVAGTLEENHARLDALEKQLDALIRTYSRQQHQTLSAPEPGQSEIQIGGQDFVIETPEP